MGVMKIQSLARSKIWAAAINFNLDAGTLVVHQLLYHEYIGETN